jgi:hypothetical protein
MSNEDSALIDWMLIIDQIRDEGVASAGDDARPQTSLMPMLMVKSEPGVGWA